MVLPGHRAPDRHPLRLVVCHGLCLLSALPRTCSIHPAHFLATHRHIPPHHSSYRLAVSDHPGLRQHSHRGLVDRLSLVSERHGQYALRRLLVCHSSWLSRVSVLLCHMVCHQRQRIGLWRREVRPCHGLALRLGAHDSRYLSCICTRCSSGAWAHLWPGQVCQKQSRFWTIPSPRHSHITCLGYAALALVF